MSMQKVLRVCEPNPHFSALHALHESSLLPLVLVPLHGSGVNIASGDNDSYVAVDSASRHVSPQLELGMHVLVTTGYGTRFGGQNASASSVTLVFEAREHAILL